MNHGPVWLRPDVVVALHEEQVGEYGGPAELRHEGFLDAALARAYRLWEYECRDLPRLAAAYAAGIVQNLPFTAGNERTAFLSAYVFLARNGLSLKADEAEAAVAVLDLSRGAIEETGFAAWLADRCVDQTIQ